MDIPSIFTGRSLTVMFKTGAKTILDTHPEFEKAVELFRDKNWNELFVTMDKTEVINKFGAGEIKVMYGKVMYHGEELHGTIVERILQFIDNKIDAQPLLNFLNKLMENPSRNSVKQLYGFLEHKNMPIDPDGDFYAYKAVRNDFTDKHTGTIDNSIGKTVEVPRNTVDDRSEKDCSFGLHAGSYRYVKHFASCDDKIIIVKINPKDVVSVPNYDTTKLRCCRYTVTELYEELLPDTTYHTKELSEDCLDYCDECGYPVEDCKCCEDCHCRTCECDDCDYDEQECYECRYTLSYCGWCDTCKKYRNLKI